MYVAFLLASPLASYGIHLLANASSVTNKMHLCRRRSPPDRQPRVLQSYLFQMIRGLEFCHARGVMHR